MSAFETISIEHLSLVAGGQGPAQQPQPQPQQPQAPRAPGDYSTNGNPVQQGGQMIDNASRAWSGARRAGASWYESLGNAAIGLFNLDGGFDANGRPR